MQVYLSGEKSRPFLDGCRVAAVGVHPYINGRGDKISFITWIGVMWTWQKCNQPTNLHQAPMAVKMWSFPLLFLVDGQEAVFFSHLAWQKRSKNVGWLILRWRKSHVQHDFTRLVFVLEAIHVNCTSTSVHVQSVHVQLWSIMYRIYMYTCIRIHIFNCRVQEFASTWVRCEGLSKISLLDTFGSFWGSPLPSGQLTAKAPETLGLV